MKIGIDIRNIGKKRTGDEVVFFNLVKNLAQIDSINEYLLFTDTNDFTVLQYTVKNLGIENKKNFQIISLPLSFPRRRESSLQTRFRIKSGMTFFNNKFTWNFWTLPRYLKKNPVDVYHTQYILPFCVPKKIKLITHIHDVSFNAYPEKIKFLDLFFLKTLIPRSLKKADKIIAVSEFTKNEIVKYYQIPEEKIEVVYNAVGDNFTQEISEEKIQQILKSYNLTPKAYILYLGTMQPRKNLPVLIEAFASLKDKTSYKLVLCGNRTAHNFDKKIDTVIEKYNLQDSVIFPGFIDEIDKPVIFKLAKIFCFPSLYEGFSIPILEAMVAGTPVMASDIPPHREVAGEAALFFNPENSQDLAEKLEKIISDSDLRNDLIQKGLEQAQKFSWKKSAEKLLKIYQNIQIDNK
ncbi:MAG: glycosyltransferase family 1 protein [Candidatus Moranbacteria bacterium]|nr:glycosyltransferase family 1 protein [Candidatus Moranbacteria bacterium]